MKKQVEDILKTLKEISNDIQCLEKATIELQRLLIERCEQEQIGKMPTDGSSHKQQNLL